MAHYLLLFAFEKHAGVCELSSIVSDSGQRWVLPRRKTKQSSYGGREAAEVFFFGR